MKLLCKILCLLDWLDPAFIPPDATTDAWGHRVYSLNDQSLTGSMLCHISQLDYKAMWDLKSSRAVYAELQRRHEKLGSHVQILLIEKVMKIEFVPGTHIAQTWDEIDMLIKKIKAIGPLNYDQLKTAIAIKALGRHYVSEPFWSRSFSSSALLLQPIPDNATCKDPGHHTMIIVICNCILHNVNDLETGFVSSKSSQREQRPLERAKKQ